MCGFYPLIHRLIICVAGMAGMVPGLFHTGGFRSQYGLDISAQQCVVYFESTTHISDLPVCYLIFVAASFVEEWPCQLTSYVEVKLIFACTVRYPAVSRSSRYLQTTRPHHLEITTP
jgi:hypothetical protein